MENNNSHVNYSYKLLILWEYLEVNTQCIICLRLLLWKTKRSSAAANVIKHTQFKKMLCVILYFPHKWTTEFDYIHQDFFSTHFYFLSGGEHVSVSSRHCGRGECHPGQVQVQIQWMFTHMFLVFVRKRVYRKSMQTPHKKAPRGGEPVTFLLWS